MKDHSLKRDSLDNILCDKCEVKLALYYAKPSKVMNTYLGVGWSKRKLWHLCLRCTRDFGDYRRNRYNDSSDTTAS